MKRWILPCVTLFLLCVTQIYANVLTRQQALQQAAADWQGVSDLHYVQISSFFPGQSCDLTERTRDTILRAFSELDGAPVVCFGGMQEGSAAYAKRQMSGDIYKVSSEFFQIHSFPVRNGSLFSFGNLGNEAVLNRAAAWSLFGSEFCVGEDIQIGAESCRVCAVIDDLKGAINRRAFGDCGVIFLPVKGTDAVTFCEAVLPEPVDGYALKFMQQVFDGAVFVENTGRFFISRLWEAGKELLTGTQPPSVSVPPWEFAARQTAYWLLLLWLFRLIFATVFLIYFTVMIVSFHPISRIRKIVVSHDMTPLHFPRKFRIQRRRPTSGPK